MDLGMYVDDIHRQLFAAAEAGGEEARTLAERLVAPLDAAIRLAFQDVMAAAAEEITCELAPGSVELRLRGRNPEFVVTAPPADLPGDDRESPNGWAVAETAPVSTAMDGIDGAGAPTRINLRLPDQLKARIEQAASGEGLSVNTWLVRAATAALERTDPGRRRQVGGGKFAQRYTGWAR